MISGALLGIEAAILRWPSVILRGMSRLLSSQRNGEGSLVLLVELNVEYVAHFGLQDVLIQLDLILSALSILLYKMSPYSKI